MGDKQPSDSNNRSQTWMTTEGCLTDSFHKNNNNNNNNGQSNLTKGDTARTNYATSCSMQMKSWQIVAKWLDIAQWSQWTAYRKPPPLFRMVH